MTALIKADHVTKVYGGGLFDRNRTTALEDFSLEIQAEPPSITAVVGESGSGKTTLAHLLLGLVQPTEGSVLYNGTDLRKLSSAQQRQFLRAVQVIFQDPFEVYNPFYQVDHVLTTPVAKLGLAKSPQEGRDKIAGVLRAVGLRPEETLGRYPHQLSGGQRQRLMVARALLMQPRLIIADEPVSMIDASLRATILGSLSALRRDFGISIVYITHDLTTAYQISDNIIVLYRGSVAEAGDVEQVVHHPEHPYTRLLVSSIPLPRPERRWSAEPPPALAGQKGSGRPGCKFVDRCPSAMPMCLDNLPPLYRTHANRVAACHLYREHEAIPLQDMSRVFATAGTASPSESQNDGPPPVPTDPAA